MRKIHDAPRPSDNFTKEEIKAAMAFPLRMKERTLEPWEIDLMNTFKGYEKEILDLIEAQFSTGSCNDRWLAIARTDLQKGFMCLQRAIAKPAGDAEPSLGAQVRKLGLTGEGEGNYD